MEQFYLLILVGFTSACAYLIGARRSRRSGAILSGAVGRVFECVGLTAVFLVVNVTVGVIAALGTRVLMARFVSIYFAADPTLLGLSVLQALTLQWWKELSKRSPG